MTPPLMGMTPPLEVTFPSGKRVDVRVGHHVVATDQPVEQGGADAAPGPFELFLASIAACAGTYALAFCQARRLDTRGLGVTLRYDADEETHLPSRIALDVALPADFPAHYRAPLLRAVEGCKVKRTIAASPTFDVHLASEGA